MIGKKSDFLPSDVIGEHVQTSESSQDFERHIIPPRDKVCPHCQALLWTDERLASSSKVNP